MVYLMNTLGKWYVMYTAMLWGYGVPHEYTREVVCNVHCYAMLWPTIVQYVMQECAVCV